MASIDVRSGGLALLLLGLGGCPASLPARACTEIGCSSGLFIEFEFRDPGTYTFTVTVDDVVTKCAATLPLPSAPDRPCDRDDVTLALSGSALPAAQHSLGGLHLPTTAARSVSIKATRDGMPLGDLTFAPDYKVSPGPNGPDCEPKDCRRASRAFP